MSTTGDTAKVIDFGAHPTMLAVLAERVKDAVPLRTAAAWQGYRYPDHHTGRHACPACHQPGEVGKDTLALYDEQPTRWHCFKCHQGGDVIDWLAARLACSKREAMQRLAVEAGVSTNMDDIVGAITAALSRPGAGAYEGERAAAMRECRKLFWQARGSGYLHDLHDGYPDEYTQWLAAYWRAETSPDYMAGLAWCRKATALMVAEKIRGQPPKLPPGLQRASLTHITAEAHQRLVRVLKDKNPRTDAARAWAEKNSVTAEVSSSWGIGYIGTGAPDFTDREAQLVTARGTHLLADRVVVPIMGLDRQVCAMAGRRLDDSNPAVPKWVNSAESPIFRKRETLYGMHTAQVARGMDAVVLVEGYMDAVEISGLGLPCFALMGTALSGAHIEIIRRLVSRVVLLFDGDEAGRHATEAATAALDEVPGLTATPVLLGNDLDPADVCKNNVASVRLQNKLRVAAYTRKGVNDMTERRLDRARELLSQWKCW